MRSYRIVEYGAPLQLFQLEEPPPPSGTEVLLRVVSSGVCHTDLHIWEGGYNTGEGKMMRLADRGQKLPHTMGHEIAGRVVAAGPQAGGVRPGDMRLVYPWQGCGECALCRADREYLCPSARYLGVFRPGGYADHVMIPHSRYLIDIGTLDPVQASLFACSGLTAYAALKKLGPQIDRPVLVIGAGGVGLMALSILHAMGGAGAIVLDVDPKKRGAALEAGALAAIDSAAPDAIAQIQEAAGGPLWSVVDFVGAPPTWSLAFGVAGKGATYVMVGLYGGEATVALPTIPLRALSIMGSFVGSRSELIELIELAKRGNVSAVPVERRPLSTVNETLADLKQGRLIGRAVLEP